MLHQNNNISVPFWAFNQNSCMITMKSRNMKRDADIENRLVDTAGEGEGGMSWESSIGTYISICKTDSGWEDDVWPRKQDDPLLLRDNLEGWDGAGEGV